MHSVQSRGDAITVTILLEMGEFDCIQEIHESNRNFGNAVLTTVIATLESSEVGECGAVGRYGGGGCHGDDMDSTSVGTVQIFKELRTRPMRAMSVESMR